MAAIAAAVASSAAGGQLRAQQLPDLGVAPIDEVLIATGAEGKRELRFTTSIANVGDRPLEVVSLRSSSDGEWTVFQRVWRADGDSSLEMTRAHLGFNGSPTHGHWHIRHLARYELRRLSDLSTVRIVIKRGFCLYDSRKYRPKLPAAPPKFVYERSDCGTKSSARTTTGVSVGWRDDYYWRTAGQSFDITELPVGKYRLYNRVDPRNWFRETNEQNNTTWVDLRIGERVVKVVGRSPRL